MSGPSGAGDAPVDVEKGEVPAVDVVVVDDAQDVRAVVVQFLSLDERFRVVAQGGTGAEAVALAERHRPTVMMLDASMPDIDGLSALPAVLERSPGTRVVLFSGFSGEALTAAARSLGAAAVIDKGTPLGVLASRLLQVAGRGAAEVAAAADVDGPAPGGDRQGTEGEAALAKHLERFRTVFDQGAIGMATMTLTGTIVRANPALCAMLGAPEETLVTSSYADLVAERTGPALRFAIADVASGRKDAASVEHLLASPQERWLHSTVAAVRGESGTPLYLFAQAEEITERRSAMEELRRSEERFRLLVEGVRDYAIFMLDPSGYVTTWNLGAERMKGYRTDEIVGRHFRIFYEEQDRATGHPEHNLERAVADGRYEEEGWRVRKDGSRFWANVVVTALFDRTGELAGFAKVTRDISERRETAEAHARFTAQLETANESLKRAAQQTAEFVAVTTHELRSPIAAVTGAATILRDYWDVLDADARVEALNSLLRGGTRLRRLIEDLLTVSRLEAGSFRFDLEVVALQDVIDEVLVDQVELLGEVAVECPPGISVKADRMRCAQILTNLLENAAIHGAPPVKIVATTNGPHAEVRVFDAGTGPPDQVVDRLFDKFVRGRVRDESGSGLGLYIVRELARGQGGEAWFERGDSAGPCFVLTLPLA